MSEARVRSMEERAGLRVPVPESVTLRDRVRWGPIWAGIVLALAIQLVLTAIGIAIGLVTSNITTLAAVRTFSLAIGIWAAVSLIISLFVGSYAAARFMPVDTHRMGIMHGVMVWALTMVVADLLLILIAGVVAILISTAAVTTVITLANLPAAARLTAADLGWFILWTSLALGAAVLGGYLGMISNQVSR